MIDLEQIPKCQVMIETKKKELQWFIDTGKKAVTTNDKHLLERMKEGADECVKVIKEQEQLLQEVKDAFDSLPDARMKTIFDARYFVGASWEDISQIVNTSKQTCFDLHKKGLKILKGGDS